MAKNTNNVWSDRLQEAVATTISQTKCDQCGGDFTEDHLKDGYYQCGCGNHLMVPSSGSQYRAYVKKISKEHEKLLRADIKPLKAQIDELRARRKSIRSKISASRAYRHDEKDTPIWDISLPVTQAKELPKEETVVEEETNSAEPEEEIVIADEPKKGKKGKK